MSVSVFNLLVLARARGCRLAEMLGEVRLFGKRAKEPADRVAFAEIEQELLYVQEKWLKAGLLFHQVGPCGTGHCVTAEVAGAAEDHCVTEDGEAQEDGDNGKAALPPGSGFNDGMKGGRC